MREMKFRQRNKNNGQWFYWGFINGKWVNPKQQANYVNPEESDGFTSFVDSEKIAEIRNALQVIQLNCQQVPGHWMSKDRVKMTKTTIEQIKRIDKLLPQVKFEGGK